MAATSSIRERITPPPRSRKRKRSPAEPHLLPQRQKLTIYSWNVNGISPFLQPSVASYFKPRESGQSTAKGSLREFLRRHEWPTVLFLQEVKINPDDKATIRAVEKAVRRQPDEPSDAHDYKVHFCLPSDKFNAAGFGRKVYGVCSIVRADFAAQFVEKVRPVTWDAEGRFLVMETRAALGIPRKLAIINVYAVNGTENPYKNPDTGEVSGSRHDRKLRVHELLQAECRQLEADGFGVIIAGDINIARFPLDGHPNLRTVPKQHCLNRADFESRFIATITHQQQELHAPAREDDKGKSGGLGMIDTFRFLHPTQRGYTYYPRTKNFGESCDRVDMILISRVLQNSLKKAGMHETAQERGTSDHVPLFAELEFEHGPVSTD